MLYAQGVLKHTTTMNNKEKIQRQRSDTKSPAKLSHDTSASEIAIGGALCN